MTFITKIIHLIAIMLLFCVSSADAQKLKPVTENDIYYDSLAQAAIQNYEKYMPKCKTVEDRIETLYYKAQIYWDGNMAGTSTYCANKATEYYKELVALCKKQYGELSVQYVVALSLLDWMGLSRYAYSPHDGRISELLGQLYPEKNRQLWCLKILASLWSIQMHECSFLYCDSWYLCSDEKYRRPLEYGFFNICKAIDRDSYPSTVVCNRAVPFNERDFDYYYHMVLSSYDVRYCTLLTNCDHLFTCYDILDIACNHINRFYDSSHEGLYETIRPLLEVSISSRAYENRTEENISAAYDAILLRKGLALLTQHRASLFLGKVDKQALYDISSEYIEEREHLHFLRLHTEDPDSVAMYNKQISELSMKYKNAWDELGKTADDNYVDFMSITWQRVRESLHDEDVAIEFVRLPEIEGANYYALTLRSDYDYPHLIPLCKEADFSGHTGINAYDDASIYNLVWKPLEEEIFEAKNIYFSADGLLHNMPLEYIPDTDLMSFDDAQEGRRVYRLSSTREVFTRRHASKTEQVAIYGGIDYSTDTTSMRNIAQRYEEPTVYYAQERSVEALRDISFGYLTSTLTEALAIDSICQRVGANTSLYINAEGCEPSFKALSGKKHNIIHIATHGFYLDEFAAQDGTTPLSDKYRSNLDRNGNIIDDPMLRSGLLFSGADNILNDVKVPEGIDDGILYSKEVGELDLHNTDLVVLSACQTAQGEILSEGVYGLQRGFKQAGVGSILMSLWKVNDEATNMLMQEFYHQLLECNKSKYEALQIARNKLRHSEQFSDPRYWAAFILLDAQ